MAQKMQRRGWQVVAVNNRGSAHELPLTSPRCFSGADTKDLKQVISHLKKDERVKGPLLAVGFSLGGTLLCKYLAEAKDDSLITAAVALCTSFDMNASNQGLEGSLFKRIFYNYLLTLKLKKYFKRNEEIFSSRSSDGTTFLELRKIDPQSVLRARTIQDYDTAFASKVLGFESATSYYQAASVGPSMPEIRIPLLCVNSEDDPVVAPYSLDSVCQYQQNIIQVKTKEGGHIGWQRTLSEFVFDTTSWIEQPVCEYFSFVLRNSVKPS